MAQQAELAKARGETVEETETSQSDWSDDHDDDVGDGVENVKNDDRPINREMSTSAVVTDFEADVDADDRGHDGDMDDTSMSSRGSPRPHNPNNVGEM
jgi:hypothetical protein